VPGFMQKGNTLFLLRNIIPDPNNPLTYAQPQFAGLLFKYNELDALSTFDLTLAPKEHLVITGDYVRNVAYNGSLEYRYAAQGVYPVTNYDSTSRSLESGPNAFMGQVLYGEPDPRERWEWNIVGGYKYLQPDAVIDAFNDNYFHLGGTNAKGYFVKGSVGLYHNTWLQASWFSADQVYGPPLAIDVLQVDLYTAF
jgi:hypothetical protein